VAMTDDQARNVQQYEYDSFGNQHDMKNRIKQPYGYTGREHDRETGLRYYRARYYDGEVGRFISEDPIGFAGGDVNLYNYVGANSVNFVDPSGLDTWEGLFVEGDAFALFFGYSKGVGRFNNNETSESCLVEFSCYKVGVGGNIGVSGNKMLILNGPNKGVDLAGRSVGMGLDVRELSLSAGVDKNGTVPLTIGASVGQSLDMYGYVCDTEVKDCFIDCRE